MNVKNHHFSIRLHVSSRTTGKQKCGVAFLHSQLFTLGGFGITEWLCANNAENFSSVKNVLEL